MRPPVWRLVVYDWLVGCLTSLPGTLKKTHILKGVLANVSLEYSQPPTGQPPSKLLASGFDGNLLLLARTPQHQGRNHWSGFLVPRELGNGSWKVHQQLQTSGTRWASTSYKWSYNPYKWPCKWVTGVITLLTGVISPFITSRGPPCTNIPCWKTQGFVTAMSNPWPEKKLSPRHMKSCPKNTCRNAKDIGTHQTNHLSQQSMFLAVRTVDRQETWNRNAVGPLRASGRVGKTQSEMAWLWRVLAKSSIPDKGKDVAFRLLHFFIITSSTDACIRLKSILQSSRGSNSRSDQLFCQVSACSVSVQHLLLHHWRGQRGAYLHLLQYRRLRQLSRRCLCYRQ